MEFSHDFSVVNNNFWCGYQEFQLEELLLKFGSQSVSAADDWKLVKFEKSIGRLIDGVLSILLIFPVRKRFSFHYFLFHVKERGITWVLSFWNLHIFIDFQQTRTPEKKGRKVKLLGRVYHFSLLICYPCSSLSPVEAGITFKNVKCFCSGFNDSILLLESKCLR